MGRRVGVEAKEAAHDQAARDTVGDLAGRERGESDLGDLGGRDPLPVCSPRMAFG